MRYKMQEEIRNVFRVRCNGEGTADQEFPEGCYQTGPRALSLEEAIDTAVERGWHVGFREETIYCPSCFQKMEEET